jgi:hypothetical protein
MNPLPIYRHCSGCIGHAMTSLFAAAGGNRSLGRRRFRWQHRAQLPDAASGNHAMGQDVPEQ